MDKRISFVFVAVLLGLGAWSFVAPGREKPGGEASSAKAATQPSGAEQGTPAAAPGGKPGVEAPGPGQSGGQQGLDGGAQTAISWEQAKMRFGSPGEPGSIEVVFDNLGGTVESVKLMDVYTQPGLTSDQKLDPSFWYPIITPMEASDRAIYSYRLEDLKERFGVRIEAVYWKMQRHDEEPRGVTFTLDVGNGLSLDKEFRHAAGARHLDLTVRLRRAGGSTVSEQDVFLRLLGPYALPNPPRDQVFGNPSRVIGQTQNRQTAEAIARYEAPNLAPNTPDYPNVVVTSAPSFIRFVASVNRFFAGILAPRGPDDEARLAMAELLKAPRGGDGPNGEKPFSTAVPVLSFYLPVPKDGNGSSAESVSFRLYLGPKDNRVFESRPEYQDYLAIRDIDLEPACFCSIPGARPLGKLLLWIMNLFHGLVNSWGLAIIMLTILVRGALVPLNFKQQKSLRAYTERIARLKPKMDAIKEKYKKNQQRLNQELMAFNKEHKLFPPLMGCLPMLVTLPVFIGLFTALRIAYELRHEDFLWFIKDLSEPDRLIPLPPFSVPLLGVVSGINVLPFVMVGLWLFLQRGMPLATDPQQRQMQKMMKWMPILMGVTFFNYASALMVYMISSSLFGIVEQKITKAKLGSLAPGAVPTI